MKKIYLLDQKLISFFNKISIPLSRFALFVVYFWFGLLKVIGLSPASQMVYDLHHKTISFIPFDIFFILFALFECLIGVMFIVKGFERVVLPLLLIHIFTTALPLLFLGPQVWQSFLVPTLEGQYIIKNILLIAAAIAVVAKLKVWQESN